MSKNPPEYMTTKKEQISYWTYFIGQNIYYNITAAFISTYLAMQGISLAKVAVVLLIVKIWDAVNDPIFGFIFDKVKFKNGLKSLPWLRLATALIPLVTIIGGSLPGLFAGALVTETLFAIPGIGYTAYQAMIAGDIPFSIFYLTFLAALTLLGNLLSDILYAVVDPRVRLEGL